MMAKKFPTDSDYANSNKNLEAEDYEVDYAITHTCHYTKWERLAATT